MKEYKDIEELSDSELLDLTEDDIERLANYMCAKKGVPFFISKPNKPEISDTNFDISVFEIKGAFFFKSLEDAQKVVNIIEQLGYVTLDYNKYIDENVDRYDRPQIEKREVYTYEKYSKIKEDIVKNKALISEYEQEIDRWEESLQGKKDIKNIIIDAINKAKKGVENIKDIKTIFKEYLKLFPEDRDKAKNSFFLTYPDWDTSEIRSILAYIVVEDNISE